MHNITVIEATTLHSSDVSELVQELLIELEPSSKKEIESMKLDSITKKLLENAKILAFIAKSNETNIGVITLHECASIYAGGVFGEISELYVQPNFRSLKVGDLLISHAMVKGKELGWKRIEVGSPPENEAPRTIQFYEKSGFKSTGSRLRRLIEP